MPGEVEGGADTSGRQGGGSPGQPTTTTTSTDSERSEMPLHILVVAMTYMLLLVGVFVSYGVSPTLRNSLPTTMGPMPVAVLWYGATGAVLASLFGIFTHNDRWDPSYNYWHYCRLILGAVTGSIGALLYLVLLKLGTTSAIHVDDITFYVVAFVFGFADKSFLRMLHNVASVIIKPGTSRSQSPS